MIKQIKWMCHIFSHLSKWCSKCMLYICSCNFSAVCCNFDILHFQQIKIFIHFPHIHRFKKTRFTLKMASFYLKMEILNDLNIWIRDSRDWNVASYNKHNTCMCSINVQLTYGKSLWITCNYTWTLVCFVSFVSYNSWNDWG